MKNSEENIDKMMRDRNTGRDFGNPPQDFLNDLNERLDKRDRGSFFGPWNGFLDVILILVILLLPLFDTSTLSNANLQNKSVAELQEQVSEEMSNDITEENGQGNLSTIEKEREKKAIRVKNNSENNSGETLNVLNTSSTSQRLVQRNINSDEPSNSRKNNNSVAPDSSVNDEKTEETRTTNIASEQVSASANNSGESNSAELKDSKGLRTNETPENKIEQYQDERSLVYANQYPIIESKIRNWDFPPIVSSNSNFIDEKSTKNIQEAVSPISWETQLFAGLNFPTLNSSTGQSASTALLNQQSGFTASFSIGARLTMWYNNLSVTSGADLLSVKEENMFELSEVETYDSTYVTNVDTTIFYDSVQQTLDTTYTYDYDSITVTDTTINIIPVSQQYSWVQIPLQVGYKFQFNKWAIIPRAGLNLAIGIRQQNKSYPNELFDQLQTYTPAAKVLMNLSGSLEVRRDFNNWHIFARGDYQTGMRPILTGGYFERRYSGFRMNVGIGLTLN